MFNDRYEAGRLLAARLRKYQDIKGVVLAVPRGGIPVAFEVARELHLPIELILVKKLGHPLNKEYAIGAVGLTDRIVIPHEDVTSFYIDRETERIRTRLREMQKKFMGAREPEKMDGKTIIIIDDGIATGTTLATTLKILRKSNPAKIIIAVPVISKSAMEKLSSEADEIIALLVPERFMGVGAFYNDFMQVSDEEVLECIQRLDEIRKVS